MKIKTIELVANLARQGMPSSLHGPLYKILIYDIVEILIVKLVCDMWSENQPQGYACMHHHYYNCVKLSMPLYFNDFMHMSINYSWCHVLYHFLQLYSNFDKLKKYNDMRTPCMLHTCIRPYCRRMVCFDADDERKEAVKANSLLPMIVQLKDNSSDVQFQALRATGNLCYEHGMCIVCVCVCVCVRVCVYMCMHVCAWYWWNNLQINSVM